MLLRLIALDKGILRRREEIIVEHCHALAVELFQLVVKNRVGREDSCQGIRDHVLDSYALISIDVILQRQRVILDVVELCDHFLISLPQAAYCLFEVVLNHSFTLQLDYVLNHLERAVVYRGRSLHHISHLALHGFIRCNALSHLLFLLISCLSQLVYLVL